MQFKQFFIALCALTLIFSACKKDETPVLPEVTGLWEVVTFIVTDCDNPAENGNTDAAELACTGSNTDYCTEYVFDFKDDGTFLMEATVFVAGQSIGEPLMGTYRVLSENEIEICYNDDSGLECITASLNNNQITAMGPDEESECQLGFILEEN